MSKTSGLFEIEQQGNLAIVIPVDDLRELDYQQIEVGAKEIVKLLDESQVKDVVLDFHKTDYYGSTALAFFVNLWKKVCSREGQMVFCRVSEHERQILSLTKLDTLWPVCGTREDAFAEIGRA